MTRLPDDYVAQAVQDARRFQGAWTGTAGTLAAHTFRLATERRHLLATIDELERKNADLRAAVEKRLAATLPADVPEDFTATLKHVTLVEAAPQKPAEFIPTRVGATMSPDQLESAWAAIAAKAGASRDGVEPIRSERISGPRIIGISGRAGSGKNAVAGMIPGATVVQLADPLYAGLSTMFGIPEALLRNRDFKVSTVPGVGLSPRKLLQTLGTEWGRDTIRDDIWLVMLSRRVEQFAAAGVPVVAVADVRFENEAAWIRERGGEVWHVYRHGPTHDTHTSELGIEVRDGDRVIDNTGTLDDLRRAVLLAFAPLPA